MKVTTATLSRKSVIVNCRPFWSTSANAGAGPTTGRRASSFAPCAHAPADAGASSATSSIRHTIGSERISGLELPLQFVEVPPVSALRDQFLRRAVDHAGFAQTQGIEHMFHIAKALASEQLGRNMLGTQADGGNAGDANARRFGRRFCDRRPPGPADQVRCNDSAGRAQ